MKEKTVRAAGRLFVAGFLILSLAACGDEPDETVPELTVNPITTPTNSNSIFLSGTVEQGGLTEVETTPAQAAPVPVTYTEEGGRRTWSSETVQLKEGSNSITVTGTDGRGNTHVIRQTVILDSTPPSVLSRSPEEDAVVPAAEFKTITVTFSEPVKAETVSILVSDAAAQPVGGATTLKEGTTATFTWMPAATLSAGKYDVSMGTAVKDELDNSADITPWSFTIQ